MKRVLKLMTVLSSLLLIFANISYADNNNLTNEDKETVIYQATPITDINILFERAKKGITDIEETVPSQKLIIESAIGQNLSKEENAVEYYTTTQKIKAVKKGEEVTETYATTNFAIMSAGSVYQTTPDSSGGVVAYSTINYDRQTNNGLFTYKLISVTGGWNPHDSTISLSNRIVRYGISGNKPGGGNVNEQSGDIPISVNAYGFSAPSTWGYVETSWMILGSTSEVTLTRGGSQWLLRHVNNLQY